MASRHPDAEEPGRECVGVEPTRDDAGRPADGFEDREHHRAPSTPLMLPIVAGSAAVWQTDHSASAEGV